MCRTLTGKLQSAGGKLGGFDRTGSNVVYFELIRMCVLCLLCFIFLWLVLHLRVASKSWAGAALPLPLQITRLFLEALRLYFWIKFG